MKNSTFFFLSLLFASLFSIISFSQTNIIINEFSQGTGGTAQDWIELVVTADGTNIQGVYIDKDDSLGAGSIWDEKKIQLNKTLPAFASVNKGSIIVIYNGSTTKDPTLPADDIDFTDGKILIPHTNTTFLETGATWVQLIATGDAIGIFNDDLTGIHGVAYGVDGNAHKWSWSTAFPLGTSWGMTDITSLSVGSGMSAHFVEDTPQEVSTAANWTTIAFSSATPLSLNGGNNNALPVELSSFTASVVGSKVKLNWRTETEVNNYGFEVERKVGSLLSSTGNYQKIGFVNGNGNSNSPKDYSYVDEDVTSGKYSYRLKQIDNDGQFEYFEAIEVDLGTPEKFELSQNYPNPFNPITKIKFTLPAAGNVKLTLFNILGQEVKTLVNGFREAGAYAIDFNASELNSGIYIYTIESGSFVQTRKMILLK